MYACCTGNYSVHHKYLNALRLNFKSTSVKVSWLFVFYDYSTSSAQRSTISRFPNSKFILRTAMEAVAR